MDRLVQDPRRPFLVQTLESPGKGGELVKSRSDRETGFRRVPELDSSLAATSARWTCAGRLRTSALSSAVTSARARDALPRHLRPFQPGGRVRSQRLRCGATVGHMTWALDPMASDDRTAARLVDEFRAFTSQWHLGSRRQPSDGFWRQPLSAGARCSDQPRTTEVHEAAGHALIVWQERSWPALGRTHPRPALLCADLDRAAGLLPLRANGPGTTGQRGPANHHAQPPTTPKLHR